MTCAFEDPCGCICPQRRLRDSPHGYGDLAADDVSVRKHSDQTHRPDQTKQNVARHVTVVALIGAVLFLSGGFLLPFFVGMGLAVLVSPGRLHIVIPGSALSLAAALAIVYALFHPSGADHWFGIVYYFVVICGWPVLALLWAAVAAWASRQTFDMRRRAIAYASCFFATAALPAAALWVGF